MEKKKSNSLKRRNEKEKCNGANLHSLADRTYTYLPTSHLKERIHALFFSANDCILEILAVRLTVNLGVRRHWGDVNVRLGPSISKSNFNQMPVESYC